MVDEITSVAVPTTQSVTTTVQTEGKPLLRDEWIYRMVVVFLGLTILGAAGGSIYLSVIKAEVPAILVSIGSTAVGVLGGLLAPSPSAK